ncbi:MAG TPA: hypothetical protein VHB02_16440 [Acidimicrobiales bacterium]|nr:hypothetical protein [Acidimicrobiales bacterium]
MRAGTPPAGLATVVAAVAVRPRLWPVAVALLFRLAASGWWRRWPPVPAPDAAYWRFRMVTAYGGSGDAPPRKQDVVSYLAWCRRMGRACR